MKNLLVVSNIILIVLLLSVVLIGCSGSDSRVDWAITQIQTLQSTVSQLQSLQSTVDQNTVLIQTNAFQIAQTQANLQSAVDQIQQYLNQLAQ